MKWFSDLSTRNKLFFGFGLIILLLAVGLWFVYMEFDRVLVSKRQMYDHDVKPSILSLRLRSDLNHNRASLFELTLKHKEKGVEQKAEVELEREMETRDLAIDEYAKGLQGLYRDDPAYTEKMNQFVALLSQYRDTKREQISMVRRGKMKEAMDLSFGKQEERYDRVRKILDEVVAMEEKDMVAKLARSEQAGRTVIRGILAAGAAILVLSLFLVVFLTRVIAGPLKELSAATERIAAGDLTVTVSVDDRKDEIGQLISAFRRMVESLRGMTREMGEVANVLAASSAEMLASVAELTAGATETATAVRETVSTVEEVKQTAIVSAQKAKNVLERSQLADQAAQSGKRSVEESIELMKKIQGQVTSIADSIVRMSEQSQAIGEITSVVNDLTEQSNLLAVNAAIEAAKAGELGKGFAVVAQEIRNLAEQSKQATGQVRTILGEIQKATTAAVLVTEQGGKAVDAGARQSTRSWEAIEALMASVDEASQAATLISASSQQQLVGMDQVTLAMGSIETGTRQTSDSSRQLETMAATLHQLGEKQSELSSRYKV
ncbi:MAG: methyl-accepting chemotaxis protein [Desulfobacteria bacterium]|nr:methyl-accepting chemotaxis protein [Deltaproteobacteria bacterium]